MRHRQTVLAFVAVAAIGCGGDSRDNPAGPDVSVLACSHATPGITAQISLSGSNGTGNASYFGDIQRISAATATPNFTSTSQTNASQKFVLILGGPVAASSFDLGSGSGQTYLSYTELGNPAKVWAAKNGKLAVVTCDGSGFAVTTIGPDGLAGSVDMTPVQQSGATGQVSAFLYGRLP
jgi:hypothetical protein